MVYLRGDGGHGVDRDRAGDDVAAAPRAPDNDADHLAVQVHQRARMFAWLSSSSSMKMPFTVATSGLSATIYMQHVFQATSALNLRETPIKTYYKQHRTLDTHPITVLRSFHLASDAYRRWRGRAL